MPLPRESVAPAAQEAERTTAGEIHRPRVCSFLRHHASSKSVIQTWRRLSEPATLQRFRHLAAHGQRGEVYARALCGDRRTVAAP